MVYDCKYKAVWSGIYTLASNKLTTNILFSSRIGLAIGYMYRAMYRVHVSGHSYWVWVDRLIEFVSSSDKLLVNHD